MIDKSANGLTTHLRRIVGGLGITVAIVGWLAGSAPYHSAHAATPIEATPEPGHAVRERSSDRASGNRELFLNETSLGEIMVVLEANGEPWVSKAALIDMLMPMLDGDRDVIAQVQAIRDQRGSIRVRALAASGFSFALSRPHLRLTRVAPVVSPSTNAAQKPATVAPGRVSVIDLALTSGRKKVGDITVEVTSPATVRLPKAALIDMLTPMLDDATAIGRLERLPEQKGFVTLDDVTAAGFAVKLQGKHLDIGKGTGVPSTASRQPAQPPSATAAKQPPPAPPAKSSAVTIGSEGLLAQLVQDGQVLGEILVRSNGQNQILLPKSALVDMITPGLEKDPAALERLVALPGQDDLISLENLQKSGIAAHFTGTRIELGKRGDAEDADPPGYATTVSARLNSTGRTITLNVPLKEGEQRLGEISVRIEPDGTINVPKAALVQQLASALDKPALAQLEKMPDKNGQIPLGDLGGADFQLAYDPNLMELLFSPSIEQRSRSELSMASAGRTASGNLVKPATLAGFVNITGGADYRWEGTGQVGLFLDLQSVVRVAGVVIENTVSYESDVDPQQCPFIAVCVYDHQSGVKRRYSRLGYDLPDENMRIQFGDVEQQAGSFQRANDVLGASIEMSPRKLAPGQSVRPTSGSSIAIERPSDVEILVNGAVSQRLRLKPGNYNLRDLPLTTGANDVELVITDDRGQRRTMTSNMFSDAKMLAAGKSEWAVSGGLASHLTDGERTYREGEYLAGGFYRYGLTDKLSFEAQSKGDNQVVEGGLGLLAGTAWGAFTTQGAVSTSDTGIGFATNVNWDLINYKGVMHGLGAGRESLRLGGEYRSSGFRSPGEYVVTSSGIIYPQTPYWLRLMGAYSFPITTTTTASLSARYQFADPQQFSTSAYRIDGDRYGADVTLSSSLGRILSTSLTAGYSNEITQRAVANLQGEASPDLRVMLRFFLRPGTDTRISGSYDTLNQSASVSAHQGFTDGMNRWEADANMQTDANAQQTVANGSLAYAGNRGDIRVSQNASIDAVDQAQPGSGSGDRTSLRFGTAIAFADGHTAIGAPIRGNGFAIVYPHESLAGKEITVGDGGTPRGKSSFLGPALVADLPAYVQNAIPVNVADLPPGYSLGSGAFDVAAPHRAGYALQVGSPNSVSAFGILLTDDLVPLPLLTGTARPVDRSGHAAGSVAIFTNQAGRFVAEGLSPGKWVIEMATEPTATRYEIDIPKDAQGLIQVGRVLPQAKE